MNKKMILIAFSFVIFFLAMAFYFIYQAFFAYNDDKMALFSGNEQTIVFEGEKHSYSFKKDKDDLLLPVSFIQDFFDEHIYIDENTKSVIVTTKDNIIQFKDDNVKSFIKEVPYELRIPMVIDKEYYISSEILSKLYPLKVHSDTEYSASVYHMNKNYFYTTLKDKYDEQISIREKPDRKSFITSYISPDEKVYVFQQTNDWLFVQKENGYYGWIEKKFTNDNKKDTFKWENEVTKNNSKTTKNYGYINLTWEPVYCCNPDVGKLGEMPGVNVVSPTWFSLYDAKGNISNKANSNYVNWAKKTNKQVWALFSNDFDPDKTHEFLKDFDSRMNAIRQIASLSNLYQIDGVNIDFENVYVKDKEHLVQFVRELTPYLHDEGLVISIDVTHPGGSDMWSKFLDRKALGEAVDYMMLMSYDEHWAASPVAGSVASLPWSEKGIVETLKEVSNKKLILGVPFYTRLWSEENGKATSQTMSMTAAENWMEEHNVSPAYDKKTKQNYVEYTEDDSMVHKMWLEDDTSMKKRIELVKKYDLAGISSWARPFSNDGNWMFINDELENAE